MEHLVLYRKYRPQSFAEIAGQEHVVRTLQNSLAQNKVAHAYLFAGPRGSGKTTIARILAKALNCASRSHTSDPCNKCPQCLDLNAGRSLDLIEIDAASNRGIDEIRNLRENVRFGPSSGQYKVYLIDEAHMITKDGFNAFLKTLEEPPAHAVFILATTEAHRLLPTIISRTQRFDFKRLSVAELTKRLFEIAKKEEVEIEPETLKLIAHEADGAARDAEGLLGQVIAAGEKKITLESTEEILGLFSHRKIKDLVDFLAAKDSAGALNWLHKTVEAGYDVSQLLKSLNNYLRKMVLVVVSPSLAARVKSDLADEDYQTLFKQSQLVSTNFLVSLISGIAAAKKNLASYPLPQMAVEVTLINLLSDTRHDTKGTAVTANEIPNTKIQVPNKYEARDSKSETVDESPKPYTPSSSSRLGSLRTEGLRPSEPNGLNSNGSNSKDILELIQSKWSDIIAEVKPYNHSLSGFLMGMKPKEASSAVLILSTKYSFHKDRLSEQKNKKIVEDAVEKITGTRLTLNCVLEK